MNINWKVRLKNPWFYVALGLSVFMSILEYTGIKGSDITTWGKLIFLLKSVALNPYLLCHVLLDAFYFSIDSTTSGLSDSKLAMTYNKPKPKGE